MPSPIALTTPRATPEFREVAKLHATTRTRHETMAGRVAELRHVAVGTVAHPLGPLAAAQMVSNKIFGERNELGVWHHQPAVSSHGSFQDALRGASQLVAKGEGTTGAAILGNGSAHDVVPVDTTAGDWMHPVDSRNTTKSQMHFDNGKSYPIVVTDTYKWQKTADDLQALVGRDWAGQPSWVDFRDADRGEKKVAQPLDAG